MLNMLARDYLHGADPSCASSSNGVLHFHSLQDAQLLPGDNFLLWLDGDRHDHSRDGRTDREVSFRFMSG